MTMTTSDQITVCQIYQIT